MSKLRKKWSVDDIRQIIRNLDQKTGMNGERIPIYLEKTLGDDNKTLGCYREGVFKHFRFSRYYFDDPFFPDSAAVDVIRHEYCHYLVDALRLKEMYEDNDNHGKAWKSVCRFLNTDDRGTYRHYYFPQITEKQFEALEGAHDIGKVNIMERLERWGLEVYSVHRYQEFRRNIIKKYGKCHWFEIDDELLHKTKGRGIVLDTHVDPKRQLLYVRFQNGKTEIIQNRHAEKLPKGHVAETKVS